MAIEPIGKVDYGLDHGKGRRLTATQLEEMLRPNESSAVDLLDRVITKALQGNGEKPPPDDVAAILVKRCN